MPQHRARLLHIKQFDKEEMREFKLLASQQERVSNQHIPTLLKEIVIISIDLINSLNSIYVVADILSRMKMKVSHVL